MHLTTRTFAYRTEVARLAHSWDVSPREATQIQTDLRSKVLYTPLCSRQLQSIAGIDVGFPRGKHLARAAVALLEFPSLKIIQLASAEMTVVFPYVPGLLSFREVPVILHALAKLSKTPDVLITDGHGLAHPRRFGLACHLGVLLDIPSIGCAKSILVGNHAPLGETRGSTAALDVLGKTVGMAVRTRTGVNPMYISVGHRVSLASAVEVALACASGYRLPEPTRLAHRFASAKS